ncbi:MAG: histidinol-phosphate transaminase [Fimbriimonadaceae bacterium]
MNLHAVHGGAFFDSIGADFQNLSRKEQVINADVLDAWYDPSPKVIEAIREHLEWLIKTSPPTHADGLRQVISEERRIPKANLALGAGSSTLMFNALTKLVGKGDRAVVMDPMYGEYEHVLGSLIGAEVVRSEQFAHEQFRPDIDRLVADSQGAKLLAMVNPNSPTGRSIPLFAMKQLLAQLDPETTLWVDETYIDFVSQEQSLETLVADHPNLIVCKSMSKFYSLSGLRVGYLACSPALATELERETPPWNIGLISQLAAVEALKDKEYYTQMSLQTKRLKDHLVGLLIENEGLIAIPSATNFVFLRLPTPSSKQVTSALAEQDIFIRDCDSLSPRFNGEYIRVAVKPEAQNERIASALAGTLTSNARN